MTSFNLTSLVLSLFVCSLVTSQCLTGEIYDTERNICYNFTALSLPFWQAETYCQGRPGGGGHLVSVHSDDQLQYLTSLFSGFTPNGQNQFWTGGLVFEGGSQRILWTDRTACDYIPQTFGYPQFTAFGITIDTSSTCYRDMNTSIARTSVCAGLATPTTPSISSPTEHPQSTAACPSGWVWYSVTDSCYTTEFFGTWEAAETYCQAYAGHLVSVHSKDENYFVASLTKTSLNATTPQEMTWTGLRYNAGQWKWSDSTPTDYIKWAPKEPSDPANKQCAMISQDGSSQLWYTADCKTEMRALVCKKTIIH